MKPSMDWAMPVDESDTILETLKSELRNELQKGSDDGTIDHLRELAEEWGPYQNFVFHPDGEAAKLIKMGDAIGAIIEIWDFWCSDAAAVPSFDSAPAEKNGITEARRQLANLKKSLNPALTTLRQAKSISDREHTLPRGDTDPDEITNEDIKMVARVIQKAIDWNEFDLLNHHSSGAETLEIEKQEGSGAPTLSPTLKYLIYNLHDLFTCSNPSRAASARHIAAWINFYGGGAHSHLTNYDKNGKKVERSPSSVEAILKRRDT
jgi:hypothetical protein